MDRPSAPDRWDQLGDQPWDVQVTVVRAPPGRVGRTQIAGVPILTVARTLVALVLVLGCAGALVLNAAPARHSRAPTAGLPAGAATESPYRYPLGCMGATLSVPRRMSAGEARAARPCWRYGLYVTAILRQVRGVWRLGLEAVSPSCPVVSLPAIVRAQLAVCRRATRPK